MEVEGLRLVCMFGPAKLCRWSIVILTEDEPDPAIDNPDGG